MLAFGIAAALGMVLYLAGTSLPYLAASPTADPLFGELNHCLMEALPEPRVGFAVSADGRAAASYGGGELAVCEKSSDGGSPVSYRLSSPGISAAAFDFDGRLWLAAAGQPEGTVSVGERGAFREVGKFAAVSLVGHAYGACALDGAGQLVSLSAAGEALGLARLPGAPLGGGKLSVNSDGTLVSVVAGTGLSVYSARDLRLVLAEGPCVVEHLWWDAESASRATISCAPGGSWALHLDAETGEEEAAPRKGRVESGLLPRLRAYVHECEGLPCTAPAP